MTTPVPLLDLAPKRKTPLSLWNPLDYLLLLYWCFFFPQAIRWYVETFGNVEYKRENRGWHRFLHLLREDVIQGNLFIQGFLLSILAPVIISFLLGQTIGLQIEWPGVAISIVFGMAIGLAGNIAFGVPFGIVTSIALGVAGSATGILATGITEFYRATNSNLDTMTSGIVTGLLFGVLFGITLGMSLSLAGGVAGGIPNNVALSVAFSLIFGLTLDIVIGTKISLDFGIFVGVIFSITFGATFSAGIIIGVSRLSDFLVTCILTILAKIHPQQTYLLFSRITPLELPYLKNWIHTNLENDPEVGLLNIDQLLRYSLQFIPVVAAINAWLDDRQSEQVYTKVNSLADSPYDWQLVFLGSVPLSSLLCHDALGGFILLPKMSRQKLQKYWDISLRMDSPARAACAGYWRLYKQDTNGAMKAFAHTRRIRHGEIMYQTAQALDLGRQVETLAGLAVWESESVWLEQSLEESLRPEMIAVLRFLRTVALDASIATNSYSKLNRSAALNRAVVALTELLNDLQLICPKLERPIVYEIVQKWIALLAREAGKAGQAVIAQPIENPFVVGNPVTGGIFVGRDEIFRRIEELWGNTMAQNLPSLVFFGHRRMGKSSILQNLGKMRFNVHTIVAQFTMQRAGRLKNTGELLCIFADQMYRALTLQHISLPIPNFDSFERSPYLTFDHFLAEIKSVMGGRRLILTIDEFELIEDAINRGAVDAELLAYLRGVIHSERWFVLALAGLHTLEEMTADYWNPLFSSVTPVRVSFLSWESTANLLANPHDDFPLDFTREAIDRVYAHVHGQPFLTQLIGHTLVRLYNQSVFENQTPREPRFSAADVDEVVERAEFYEQGQYYFQGVWSQAQGLPPGQMSLLKRLAEADGPLSKSEWLSGLDESQAEVGLKALEQHDVVLLRDGTYDFAVPLMRRWVGKNRE